MDTASELDKINNYTAIGRGGITVDDLKKIYYVSEDGACNKTE
ncbi:hypothetical protein [Anaerovorax odorimutans]|nr:hypothetical protein [Anaerovorax odorimutans]